MKEAISVRISDSEKTKIQHIIRKEYPELKTISDVVRLALIEFIENRERIDKA